MRKVLYVLIFGCMLASTATARDLPTYYPDELRRSGEIDAVNLDAQQVDNDDVPYAISEDVVVHSLQAYSVSKTRLRPGTVVAFKVGSGRQITNFWLLPRNFSPDQRR